MSAATTIPSAPTNPATGGPPRRSLAQRLLARPLPIVALWIVTVAAGLGGLARYAAIPGAASSPPSTWPADSAIPYDPAFVTVVLFLHPRCPCSSATVGELQRALAWKNVPTRLCVVLARPAGASEAWSKSPLTDRVMGLKPSVVVDDVGGREAARFCAATSGQVVIYDASGRLAFHGGVTASRGHEGDNTGRSAVSAILAGEPSQPTGTPVFGCPLCGACPAPTVADVPREATP